MWSKIILSVDNINYEEYEIRINSDSELSDRTQKLNKEDSCCENPNIILYRGIYVCDKCGIVRGPKFSMLGSRIFSTEDIENKRTNEPFYKDTGYRTLISISRVDIHGFPLKSKTRLKYLKLAKIQKSITNSYERNIMVANPRFGQITSALRLSRSVINESHNIYSKVLKGKLATGRSIEQLVAACIYVAIRVLNLPRTLEEVSKAAQISEKNVSRNYRLILNELGIKLKPQEIPPFISRFGDELEIPSHYQVDAINLFKNAKNNGLIISGDPKSYAAAAIYIIMKRYKEYKINQREVAKISYISDVTLRKKMNLIKNLAGS